MRVSFFSFVRALERATARVLRRTRRPLLLLVIFSVGSTTALVGTAAQKEAPQNRTPQNSRPRNPTDEGLFLIARRELSDPFFAKSTVLMLPLEHYPLVVGIIINKPTHMPLHELFPGVRSLQKQSATAYFGGPVDMNDRSAIFRAASPPKHSMQVFADVYITFDSDSITSLVKNARDPSKLRIFLGRSQWAKAQLQHEIFEGAWYNLRGNADPIFSADPGKVWSALLAQAQPHPYVEYRRAPAPVFARLISPVAQTQLEK